MKKRYILMAVTAALVFAVAAGGTMAANQVETMDEIATPLATQTLELGLGGGGENTEDLLVPGGDPLAIQPFTITNTKQINSYVRVTVSAFWTDPADTQDPQTKYNAPGVTLALAADAEAQGWIQAVGAPDDGPLVLYYTQPLLTGSKAIKPPLDTVKLEKTVGAEYSGMKLHIEMVADGVQFAGAGYQKVNQNAILAAWGVDATVSPETGAITNVIYRS